MPESEDAERLLDLMDRAARQRRDDLRRVIDGHQDALDRVLAQLANSSLRRLAETPDFFGRFR
ncbi:MAG TPA: hypothetical protein ENK13_04825 [Thermopetrobacter sp.]|nr:hypothetical protein [Thermopetrobacter sp.]